MHLGPALDFNALPYWWHCDRIACFGTIDLTFVVDEQGIPFSVKVTGNTYPNRQPERSAIAIGLVRKWRYEPPRVKGKAVCVRSRARLKFEMNDDLPADQ